MSRNPLIEAIHEARYDLQTCAEKDKPAAAGSSTGCSERLPPEPIRPHDPMTSWTRFTTTTRNSAV